MPKKNRKVTEDDRSWFQLGKNEAEQQAAKQVGELEAKVAAMRSTKWHEHCEACETADVRLRQRLAVLSKKNRQLRQVNHHLWEILAAADCLDLARHNETKIKIAELELQVERMKNANPLLLARADIKKILVAIKANRKKKPK